MQIIGIHTRKPSSNFHSMNHKTFPFLILFTRTPWRSFSILLVVLIITLSSSFLLTIEKNALRALSYYEYSPLDDRRFTLTQDTDLFSLFSRDSSGIEPSIIENLQKDNKIDSISYYTLVEIPVLAKFGMFQFSFETDMPIFAVSDRSLTGSNAPMGISQLLIDFYNKEFSWTSPYFPLFTKEMVLGQKITLEFWKSKLFSFSAAPSSPVAGTIASVKNDYPWFGIMVPESIVKEKLEEIWYTLWNPYKIVGYMKDPSYKDQLQNMYSTQYRIEFDKELIEKLKQKTQIIQLVMRSIWMLFAWILLLIFSFLLFGYARERSDIYRLFQALGITWVRSRMVILFEPIFLVTLWVFIGGFSFRIIESISLQKLTQFLLKKGIDFPLLPVAPVSLVILWISLFIIVSVVILSVDLLMRRKRWI